MCDDLPLNERDEKNMRIFIGVGHGGNDAGAVANGFKEKDLNLSIALACRDVLLRHGVTVGMSRTTDANDPLTEEIKECNEFKPDFAIDIHNNAGGGDGVEVFYHHKGGAGKTLAENVINEVAKIGQNSRGIKTRTNANGNDYYGFIRETIAPAIIIECAFIDNAKDMTIIDTPKEQRTMGEAIAKGILKTLGTQYKENITNDYSDSWAKTEIERCIENKIMIGDGNGNFRPKDTVTREELAKVVCNILDYLKK